MRNNKHCDLFSLKSDRWYFRIYTLFVFQLKYQPQLVMQPVSFILSLLAYRVVVKCHAQIDICNNTEIFLIPTESDQNTFHCMCDMLSTTCWWSSFADRENTFNSGSNESLFMWQRSVGYGQYICVENNSTIVKDILILPQGEKCRTIRVRIHILCMCLKGVVTIDNLFVF